MLVTGTVVLYKMFHRIGAIFLMKDLSEPIRKVDPADVARCPPGELAAFYFFHGMLLVRSTISCTWFLTDSQFWIAVVSVVLHRRALPPAPGYQNPLGGQVACL